MEMRSGVVNRYGGIVGDVKKRMQVRLHKYQLQNDKYAGCGLVVLNRHFRIFRMFIDGSCKYLTAGFDDDSCWSRGQGWGIYGYAQVAQRTGREDFVATCRQLANAFLNRLPESGVPEWLASLCSSVLF